MITDEVLRAQLVLAVENAARWRAKRAERYPADRRNISSSQSLAALAKRLESLPPTNAHFTAYIDIMERAVTVAIAKHSVLHDLSSIESRCIGRYGFDYPLDSSNNPAAFLFVLTREITDLVEEEEAAIQTKKGGEGNVANKAAHQRAETASKKPGPKRRRRPSQSALAL